MDAVQQGQPKEAIDALETLCQQVKPPSKEYYEAKLWLVRAYRDGGQLPKAISLCRQLSASPHPQVQEWAKQMLITLQDPANLGSGKASTPNSPAIITTPGPEAATLLTAPTQFPETTEQPNTAVRQLMSEAETHTYLDKGLQHLKASQWSEAIDSLRQFLNIVPPSHKNYSYAQTALAKAYKGNQQIKAAVALAHALLKSPHPASQLWAKQFLAEHEGLANKPSLTRRISTLLSVLQAPKSMQPEANVVSEPYLEIPAAILLALCYGSFYSGILLWLLFGIVPFLVFVLCHWLLPCLISWTVWHNARTEIVKSNARSALNFWLTTLGIALGIWVVENLAWSLGITSQINQGPAVLGNLMNWLGRAIATIFYGLPLFATLKCWLKPHQPFKFPFIVPIFRSS